MENQLSKIFAAKWLSTMNEKQANHGVMKQMIRIARLRLVYDYDKSCYAPKIQAALKYSVLDSREGGLF